MATYPDCLAARPGDALEPIADRLNRLGRKSLLFGGVLDLLDHVSCGRLRLFKLLRGNAADRLLYCIARLAKIAVFLCHVPPMNDCVPPTGRLVRLGEQMRIARFLCS